MGIKVYVLESDQTIVGVYSTLDKAKAALQGHYAWEEEDGFWRGVISYSDYAHITEFELDGSTIP
ncbi:MAG: hypothetical protein PHQ43_10330 [Dehalococcoidales bacterium]|nr:hypothetical protein [Dehalococcoidales bacterium]